MNPEALVLFSPEPAEAFLEELFGPGVFTDKELNPCEVAEDIAGQRSPLVLAVDQFAGLKHRFCIEGTTAQQQQLSEIAAGDGDTFQVSDILEGRERLLGGIEGRLELSSMVLDS